ncbi:ASCH domain-containing protein [Williamsoniiplasma lucivorax]|uniref:ASCH domain-containing protein n=1 Tax=Williamsoniiplasma lucivorax TaxID=209274 RepID=A0A2S5RDH9_9MOLU|nr:ASCH domain-containing protein [Williamsoniiplasma lucivorax]PPE05399.1 hypothetical protein ELUCI_v1c04910 [Williamsoniiplasma lucivorax]
MKILMSIHNEHIKNIKNGNKKFEFRKVEAKKFNDNEIFIYATAPISKVVGVAKIKKVHINTPEKIWEFTKDFSGIDNRFYDNYYENKKKAIAYEIENYIEFDQPKSLIDFGLSCAPQSFAYIK